MTGYRGGQTVREGFYLNRSTWELERVTGAAGILPGDERTRYVRLPLPVLVVAGPLMGLAYVLLLPLVFWLVFAYFLAGVAPRYGIGRTARSAESDGETKQR